MSVYFLCSLYTRNWHLFCHLIHHLVWSRGYRPPSIRTQFVVNSLYENVYLQAPFSPSKHNHNPSLQRISKSLKDVPHAYVAASTSHSKNINFRQSH